MPPAPGEPMSAPNSSSTPTDPGDRARTPTYVAVLVVEVVVLIGLWLLGVAFV